VNVAKLIVGAVILLAMLAGLLILAALDHDMIKVVYGFLIGLIPTTLAVITNFYKQADAATSDTDTTAAAVPDNFEG
jgi:F0F1-type ATP synthase assembly protein I